MFRVWLDALEHAIATAMRKRKRVTFGQLMFVFGLATVAAAGALLWAGYHFLTDEFPNVGVLKTRYPVVYYHGPKQPPTVSLQKGRPPGWVSLGEVSREAMGAVVVSEDWAFFQHKGYDSNQIREAIKEDWEEGRFVRGASTITQQVVRNVFLDKDKNLWRKVKELLLAVRIEKQVGKRRILETYFNIAEWGEGIFGIGPAARRYFGKEPSQLTAKEGAFLAMLLPSPKRYSQSFRAKKLTDYAARTVNSILDKMVDAHFITEEQRERERLVPLSFEVPAAPSLPQIEEDKGPLGDRLVPSSKDL